MPTPPATDPTPLDPCALATGDAPDEPARVTARAAGIEIHQRHRRRLREIWRSAGWPCQDVLELELLAIGLLERERDPQGRDCLRVTEAGVQVLVQTTQRNRAARDEHENLVAHVARTLQRDGRLVWTGLGLRTRVEPTDLPASSPLQAAALALFGEDLPAVPGARSASRWRTAMPDVYSIRNTSVEAYLQPLAHEIKVRRADLLSDLRHPEKAAAYLQHASQCWYVLKAGIADEGEIPPAFGVILAHPQADTGGYAQLEVRRAAPCRSLQLPFHVWMSLARSTPLVGAADDEFEDQFPLI